ncbi:MAG: hemolysin III family protein [Candidatus Dormibacteria bacterium]
MSRWSEQEIVAEAALKPLLRGYSHALAVPLAVAATTWLVRSASGRPGVQVALAIYGFTLVLLFAGSAAYHVGHWSARVQRGLQRMDHSNIFLVIAGTYTPVAVVLLSGRPRVGILLAVWSLALVGAGISVLGVQLRRGVLAALYIGVGWVAVLVAPTIFRAVGWGGSALILSAAALYTAGALCYAFKRPDPWRRVFGYHEVFHLLVIGASGLFVAFMALYVTPVR